jgi:hypothetical protein
VQGAIGTLAARDRAAIGQAFNGTVMPFLIGLTLCGASSLLIAWWSNRVQPVTCRPVGRGSPSREREGPALG